MNPKLTAILIISVTASIVALALSNIYSAYVSSTRHSAYCARNDLTLNAVSDILDLATAIPPGQTRTGSEQGRVDDFKAKANARLDRARC